MQCRHRILHRDLIAPQHQFMRILTVLMGHHDLAMRTTVTLDAEAERLPRNAAERSGQSFKEVLNQAIVKGLADDEITADEEPFEVRTRLMGLRAGYDSGRLNSLAGDMKAGAF